MQHSNSTPIVNGYTHYYYGTGKGKTTAAMGLAIRALGHQKTVYIGQFVKSMEYGEIAFLRKYVAPHLCSIALYGEDNCLIHTAPTRRQIQSAQCGVQQALEALQNKQYNVVILDEATVAVSLGLIEESQLLSLMQKRTGAVELIITGRTYLPRVAARADLVTNMQQDKHYYDEGVLARATIEY